ncbi:MAG: hypothetical protein ACFFAI_12930 [Promethearchaeota archaeon]
MKAISSFYVAKTNMKVEPFWMEFLQTNVKTEIIYPPILSLKLNRTEMVLEDETLNLIKDYSNNFINYFFE